jgi:hypothetical protein
MTRRRSGFLLSATLCLGMPLAAEESGASKAAIDSLSLGSHVFGPKVSVEDLKGHVVLIDFWGRN